MSDFQIEVTDAPVTRSTARKADERFRPIFDAVNALDIDGGKAVTVTFASADEALAAKGSVQVMAGADFTVRELRTERAEDAKSGKVTVSLVKRPKQTRAPKGDEATEVAPAE